MAQGIRTGYLAWISKRAGAAWRKRHLLIPVEVRDPIGPDCPTAKLEFNYPRPGVHVWNWRKYLAIDDRVAIVSDDAEDAHREVLFVGFIADGEWRFAATESMTITAVGYPFRLAHDREYLVYGCYMDSKKGDVTHYSNLRCFFNAGGRPNFIDASGGEPPKFTHEYDPNAIWCTAFMAIEYLCHHYNAGEKWLKNPTFTTRQRRDSPEITVDVNGLSLWEAIAKVADHGGYDVYNELTISGTKIGNRIRIVKRGTGIRVIIDHQSRRAGTTGKYPVMNLRRTNLLAATVAETTASCITEPVLAGGCILCEVTVELQKAWNPAYLLDVKIVKPGDELANATETYVERYWSQGSSFTGYADVGRLWVANTDGYYSDDPYKLSITDVAKLCDQAEGSWPVMAYRPLPMLTSLAATPVSAGKDSYLEYTIDDGTNWYPIIGYRLLPGRLGVYITTANLAAIYPPGETSGIGIDDFFTKLNAAEEPEPPKVKVKLRLTCSVASPYRLLAITDRRRTAGTSFKTSAWFDRGKIGEIRRRSASSIFSGLAANTLDDSARLWKQAEKLRDLNEDRFIESQLVLEFVDSIGTPLTGCVEKIGGINVDLQTNSGSAKRWPRIVRRQFNLDPERYQTVLTLDTERQSPVL